MLKNLSITFHTEAISLVNDVATFIVYIVYKGKPMITKVYAMKVVRE